MGLAQKRIVKEFQESVYPNWQKKILEAVGFDVPIEIKWDTMQDEAYTNKDQYFDWYTRVYFQPLVEAFKNIASDEMGRTALKQHLRKIVIDGAGGHFSPQASTFEKGVFHVKHSFNMNPDKVDERIQGWTRLLESKL